MKKEFDFVGFWGKKCRQNMKACQKEANKMVDAQLVKANSFLKNMAKAHGRKKVLAIKEIKA